LYVDEAHSIGSIGKGGKGVCEFCGVDPKDVDILMGTFTKSFGSVGGYVAGDKKLIDYLKKKSWSQYYSSPLSAVCAQQIISAIEVLNGEDGTNIGALKIQKLLDNSVYFMKELKKKDLKYWEMKILL